MINKHSADWKQVVEKAQNKINALMLDLVKDQPEASTTAKRARVAAFKDVLTWADAAQQDEPEKEIYHGR